MHIRANCDKLQKYFSLWIFSFSEVNNAPTVKLFLGASQKSSDYYWPKLKPVALRATGQVSTLTELE